MRGSVEVPPLLGNCLATDMGGYTPPHNPLLPLRPHGAGQRFSPLLIGEPRAAGSPRRGARNSREPDRLHLTQNVSLFVLEHVVMCPGKLYQESPQSSVLGPSQRRVARRGAGRPQIVALASPVNRKAEKFALNKSGSPNVR